ncbi:Glutamate receptor [Trachymyrmex cornetzi]|uniref:Glutamate receptor n=1 Tax=Trachymyrmex cornetzi TaxID=471704 RepID=A0A195DZJ3_9HYME|nr:Glutamate receptor [Trachymyrmex cornetzi]
MCLMCRVFFLQTFIIIVYAQTSQIIRDYFVYKNVTRVVGFSCGDVDAKFYKTHTQTDVGMSTAIKPAGSQIDIPRYLDTDRTMGVFVDIRCPNQNVSGIFNEGTTHRMYDYSYAWLIFGSNLNDSLQSLNDSGFSIVTDFAILLPNDSDYVLYDVYNHCKMRGGVLNVTWLGSWRENEGLTIKLTDSRINRRRDYHGMRAKAAGIVLHRPENVSLIDYLEGDSLEVMDNWPKFGHTLLSHVANMFNFTMDLIEIDHWEKNDSNGPLMGTLKRDDADLGYYPSILTIERYGYARVIFPQWPTRTCFMFRTIPATKMKPWIILKPFAADTWYSIILIVVITILILSCILKLERADDYGCSISALIAVAALCQQGFPSLSNQSASRIALIQITVFGLLVYNYYGAAIVSARLNEPLQKMNDSLYSLAHSKMQMAAEKNVFFNFLLRNPRPDVQYFRPFWNAIPESKRFISLEEGVEGIKRGGFAYHADPDDIYPSIELAFDKQMICQLTEVHLLKSELGLWSNLKSHFHEISKIALLRINTSGLRRREIRRRSARKPYCPSDEIFVSSVTIYEAAPILFLLLFGMIISLIVFGIEYFVFYTMNSKQTSDITPGIKPSIKPSVKLNVKPSIKPNIKSDIKLGIKPGIKQGIKPSIKPNIKQNIKSDVKTDTKIDKKNKILLKDKVPPKNNIILVLPEASNLFQQVLMSKQYQ